MAAIIFGRSNKTEQYDLFTTLPNSDPTTDIIVKYFPEQKNMKLAEFFAPGVTFLTSERRLWQSGKAITSQSRVYGFESRQVLDFFSLSFFSLVRPQSGPSFDSTQLFSLGNLGLIYRTGKKQ